MNLGTVDLQLSTLAQEVLAGDSTQKRVRERNSFTVTLEM